MAARRTSADQSNQIRHVEEEELKPEIDDLPDTDLEIVRDAKREQARIEANPSYGEDDFETVETNDDRVLVKPQLKPPSLSELLLLAKIRKAEREARTMNGEPSTGRVHEFLTRSKTRVAPMSEAEARPPAKASGWSWLRARFAAPKRPVWK